jgi:hypothetical protein
MSLVRRVTQANPEKIKKQSKQPYFDNLFFPKNRKFFIRVLSMVDLEF